MAGHLDVPNKETDKFGSGKHGYTDGDPMAIPPVAPTEPTAKFFDMMQMELCNAIEAAGITPDPDNYGQLAQVVTYIFDTIRNHSWRKLPITYTGTATSLAAGNDGRYGLILSSPASIKFGSIFKNDHTDLPTAGHDTFYEFISTGNFLYIASRQGSGQTSVKFTTALSNTWLSTSMPTEEVLRIAYCPGSGEVLGMQTDTTPATPKAADLTYHVVGSGASTGGVKAGAAEIWPPATSNFLFYRIASHGNFVCMIAVQSPGGVYQVAAIRYSNDAADTWNSATTPPVPVNTASVNHTLVATNAAMFLMWESAGTIEIFKTVNGGDTWTTVTGLPTFAASPVTKLIAQNGYPELWMSGLDANGDTKVMVSRDQGVTWTQATVPNTRSQWLIAQGSLGGKAYQMGAADGNLFTTMPG